MSEIYKNSHNTNTVKKAHKVMWQTSANHRGERKDLNAEDGKVNKTHKEKEKKKKYPLLRNYLVQVIWHHLEDTNALCLQLLLHFMNSAV